MAEIIFKRVTMDDKFLYFYMCANNYIMHLLKSKKKKPKQRRWWMTTILRNRTLHFYARVWTHQKQRPEWTTLVWPRSAIYWRAKTLWCTATRAIVIALTYAARMFATFADNTRSHLRLLCHGAKLCDDTRRCGPSIKNGEWTNELAKWQHTRATLYQT